MNEDIENLIMERLNDLGRKELYDKMINKKQKEVKELNRKNKELKQYNLVCKKRQEELDNFAEFLKEVLAQDTISDISMRMVVNKIVVHQNEDKTLDIKFEMNGKLGDNKEIEIPEYKPKNRREIHVCFCAFRRYETTLCAGSNTR